MAEVNTYILDSFNNLISSYTVRGASLDRINSATIVGLDAGYEFLPGLVLGARLAQITLAQGILSGYIANDPLSGRSGHFRTTFEGSFQPLMVGGSYTFLEEKRVALSAAVYIGYALASARVTHHDELALTTSDFDIPLTGSGIADDFSGQVRVALTRCLSLGADLHLMKVRVAELRAAGDVPALGIEQGSAFRDLRNSVLIIDYDTIAFGVSVNLSF